VEARHRIASGISNLLHLRQLVRAASCKVQEGESIEIFRLLVGLLHNLYLKPSAHQHLKYMQLTYLVITLFQCLLSQTFPAFWAVDDLRGLKGDVKVTTFYSQVKPGIFVLHKMECNLWYQRVISTF
jgi:hypothetical protein